MNYIATNRILFYSLFIAFQAAAAHSAFVLVQLHNSDADGSIACLLGITQWFAQIIITVAYFSERWRRKTVDQSFSALANSYEDASARRSTVIMDEGMTLIVLGALITMNQIIGALAVAITP